ncbi:hypothetical protein BASA81_005850 [Batrachochytrium salamandrivorans]|nr:hypothetical protein BASA81_005850 [Batrachochytrium salamandrivorans]
MPNFSLEGGRQPRGTLEWWRRLGLDAFLDPDDDTIKWQPVIVSSLILGATLAVLLVLSLDVIPNGATESWVAFGPIVTPQQSCETENPLKMVRQISTAMSSFGYLVVGVMVAMLTFVDFILLGLRARDKIPFSKGPNGNVHVKVTGIATLPRDHLVSVDPEYLGGNTPCLLRREPLWGVVFSLAMLFLGVSSFLNHASNSQVGFILENTAWFGIVFTFALYSISRMVTDGTSPTINLCASCTLVVMECRIQCDPRKRMLVGNLATWLSLFASLGFITLAGLFFDFTSKLILVTFYSVAITALIASLGMHYLGRSQEVNTWYELGLVSLFAFTAGLVFLYYDWNPILCGNPAGYFQAHAVWHAMSACGLGFAYLMFRSDNWMYDVVDAKEERLNTIGRDLEDAYRVPVLFPSNPNRTSESSFDQPRSRRFPQPQQPRPRTLESEFSNNSGSTRMDLLRSQQQSAARLSRRNLSINATTPVAYWTCPDCAFADNEMTFTACERCGETRPPLDEFMAVEVLS